MPLTRFAATRIARRTLTAALPSSFMPAPAVAQRPADWAVPVVVNGLPNLHRLNPVLYRSAQPSAQGFAQAQRLGIRTVISLRQTVDDAPLAAGTGLVLHRVPMKSRHVAEGGAVKIRQTLRLISEAMSDGPVLVHCHHGADRTGLICALFRVLGQGWTRDAAAKELMFGGFGFHPVWANIPRYIRRADFATLQGWDVT